MDFAEMEATLKRRILFLEQYKGAVGSRLGRLQGKLDLSVPVDDFYALQTELENLREDHLNALHREVEAKLSALHAQEQSRELRQARIMLTELKTEQHESHVRAQNLSMQLEHQKEATMKVSYYRLLLILFLHTIPILVSCSCHTCILEVYHHTTFIILPYYARPYHYTTFILLPY